jgi:CheY-like chemotaxis protein
MSLRDRPHSGRPGDSCRPHRPPTGPARWSRRPAGSHPFEHPWPGPIGSAEAAVGSVLIVDEDDFARETLARILEADGFAVTGAADGDEALARLRRPPAPDLLLLDLLAPGVGGWRALRRMRRDPALRDVPVIVVSAIDAPPTYGQQAGIVACFEKPIAVDVLLAEIRQRLARR